MDILIKECEYFKAMYDFTGIIDENIEIPDINDKSSVELFKNIVTKKQKSLDTLLYFQIYDIILISDYVSWCKEEFFIGQLMKKNKMFTIKALTELNSKYLFYYLETDTITRLNHNRIKIQNKSFMAKIYKEKFDFPVYYEYDMNSDLFKIVSEKLLKLTKINVKEEKINYSVISGGLIVGLLNDNYFCEYSDCDIFVIDECNDLFKYIREIFSDDTYYGRCNMIHYFYDESLEIKCIQIIDEKCEYDGKKKCNFILDAFDLDICKNGIYNNKLYINAKGYDEIMSGEIDCSRIEFSEKIITRLIKYKNRGFKLINLDMDIEEQIESRSVIYPKNMNDMITMYPHINFVKLTSEICINTQNIDQNQNQNQKCDNTRFEYVLREKIIIKELFVSIQVCIPCSILLYNKRNNAYDNIKINSHGNDNAWDFGFYEFIKCFARDMFFLNKTKCIKINGRKMENGEFNGLNFVYAKIIVGVMVDNLKKLPHNYEELKKNCRDILQNDLYNNYYCATSLEFERNLKYLNGNITPVITSLEIFTDQIL